MRTNQSRTFSMEKAEEASADIRPGQLIFLRTNCSSAVGKRM